MSFAKLLAPISMCETDTFNAGGSAVDKGDWVIVADVHGLALDNVLANQAGTILTRVPPPGINVPKEAPLVINKGDALYLDTGAGTVSKTTTDRYVGKAAAAAASADTEVALALTNDDNPVDATA